MYMHIACIYIYIYIMYTEAKRVCDEILGRLKDQAKERRRMINNNNNNDNNSNNNNNSNDNNDNDSNDNNDR